MSAIADNLLAVRERIDRAARRAGRDPGEITLVVVTKTQSAERINAAIDAGASAIGENRIQEAGEKFPAVTPGPARHLIGHLQRNKAGKAVELFDRIESIDSVRVAEAISRRAEAIGKCIPVLVEVNVSGEESKAGTEPAALRELLESIAGLPGILVDGLMAIGPLTADAGAIRAAFRSMRAMFDRLKEDPVQGVEMKHLSMGMSGDFEIAIEEGATIVRVGSAIFGARN